jgi:hypothetical protein
MMPRPRLTERLAPAVGPLLILATVFVATQSYLFTNRLPSQHDLLVEWLPNFCFLGRTLASAHVPTWNPHVMAGIPFAGDPLHGWMNLPAMAAFAALPCATALRLYLVSQPAIGGLGLYAFLRSEDVSRPAATVGGLVLAMEVAGSAYLGVPWVSGYFAWSAVLLAALSRCLRGESRSSRVGWAIVAGLAWGQVAAAHLAFGVLVGTGAAFAYVASRIVSDVRAGRRSLGDSLAAVGLVVVATMFLNLAYLLPVLANLSSTTLGLGYRKVAALSLQFSRGQWDGGALARASVQPTSPLQLALSPGLYLGAVPLLLAFGGLWHPERRPLFIAFALLGAVSFVLGLSVTARNMPHAILASPLGGFYLHHTDRFRDGLLFALPPVAALGTDAWLHRRSLRARSLMIAPGLAVWGVGIASAGAEGRNVLVFLAGAAAGTALLVAVGFRPRLALLLPVALSAELGASSILGLTSLNTSPPRSHEALLPLLPPRFESVDVASYLREGSIARTLSTAGGRYLSVGPEASVPSQYRGPAYWPLMTLQRSILFGLRDAQGYNSDQLTRYWSFVRKVDPKRTWYQGSFFTNPPSVALDLFQVEWVVGPTSPPPSLAGARPVIREGRWTLYRLPSVPPVSVMTAWRLVGSAGEALEAVAAPGFDPDRGVVLERSPGLPRPATAPGTARASFRGRGTQGGLIELDSPAPAVVLVRTTYHRNWRATVDGRATRVLAADYVDLGIPVPAGRHTITLTYDDPWVGWGLLGSAVALACLVGAAFLLRNRTR